MSPRYALAVAIAYAAANLISAALIIPSVYIGPIRLGPGVAMAALLLASPNRWWVVLLAMVPFHAWVGDPSNYYTVSLQYFAANAGEALVGATLVRRLNPGDPWLTNLTRCLILLAAAMVAAPLVGATVGTPVIWRRNLTISPVTTWQVWVFASAAGNLIVVPLGLALADLYRRRADWLPMRLDARRVAEAAALGAAILLTTSPAVGPAALGLNQPPPSMLYMPFPLIVWASLRFGPPGAAVATLTLAAATLQHAFNAQGLFGQPWSASNVIAVQQFLVVTAATAISLAGLTAERRRAEEAALEGQERLRLSLDAARIGTWMLDFKTNKFVISDELAAMLGIAPGGRERDLSTLTDFVHPDDRADVSERIELRRAGGTDPRRRIVRHDGTIEWQPIDPPPPDTDAPVEVRLLGPNGAVLYFGSRSRNLLDENGVPSKMVGVLIDISAQKALDQQRIETTEALLKLARSTFGDRGELDEVMREITAVAADTLGVERASVWLFEDQESSLRCVQLFERTARHHSSGLQLAVGDYPAYFDAIRQKRTLAVAETSLDPRTAELARLHHDAGITSMLDAPIHVEGQLIGVFSYQHVGEPRVWTAEARTFAASIADLLARAFESVERSKAEKRLQRAYAELRNLARRDEAAKEDERRAIARELHDELGQSLTAIVLALNLVARDARDGRHAARIQQTVALADGLIDRVRAMSLNLRPPLLDELGLMPALRGYLEGQMQHSGLRIDTNFGEGDVRVAPELEIGAFRIVQECLTNVIRHAAASRVSVKMIPYGDHLVIEVNDDGGGFDVARALQRGAQGHHLGLLGMQERITLLGGQMQILSSPGDGSQISARLPLILAP
jgi:signal transduction histidine kinase/integral membrane sensor domain MASE1